MQKCKECINETATDIAYRMLGVGVAPDKIGPGVKKMTAIVLDRLHASRGIVFMCRHSEYQLIDTGVNASVEKIMIDVFQHLEKGEPISAVVLVKDQGSQKIFVAKSEVLFEKAIIAEKYFRS